MFSDLLLSFFCIFPFSSLSLSIQNNPSSYVSDLLLSFFCIFPFLFLYLFIYKIIHHLMFPIFSYPFLYLPILFLYPFLYKIIHHLMFPVFLSFFCIFPFSSLSLSIQNNPSSYVSDLLILFLYLPILSHNPSSYLLFLFSSHSLPYPFLYKIIHHLMFPIFFILFLYLPILFLIPFYTK
ncbi:unnamed protein product [Acanthosepion pharaonis]|uniref:Uncharacterized protein n=1 Tax=Acanthosepion pharaonis TaxID=158019 RepID=A0A812E9R5_ACAPH|nr:unnamed protein product [Sepia pharaonis]